MLIASVLTDLVTGHAPLGDLTGRLVALAVVIAVRAGLAYAAEVSARTSATRVVTDLRQRSLIKVAALGPRWRSRQSGAGTSALLGSGLDGMHDYLARYLPAVVLAALVPAAMVLYLLVLDPATGLIVLLTLPLVPVFMARGRLVRRPGHHQEMAGAGPAVGPFRRCGCRASGPGRLRQGAGAGRLRVPDR